MHEMSIAVNLIEQLLRIAKQHDAARVVAVDVHCGVMQQVVPEALQAAFEAASAETLAAGATLSITEEALQARCRTCAQAYEPGIDDFVCPGCGAADAELVAGQDIILRSVECEIEDRGTT